MTFAYSGVDGNARVMWYRWYVVTLLVVVGITMWAATKTLPAILGSLHAGFWVLVAMALVVDLPIIAIWPGAQPLVLTSVAFCYALSYGWGHGSSRITQTAAILIGSVFAHRGLWDVAFDIGRYALAFAAATAAADLLRHPVQAPPTPSDLAKLLIVSATWYGAFRLLSVTGWWLTGREKWTRVLVRDLSAEALTAWAFLLSAPVLFALAITDAWLLPLVLAPISAVSQMSRVYAQRQRQATHNQLTQLPNQLSLERASQPTIRSCAEGGGGIAAIYLVDVAQLGQINYVLGHRVGDDVLVAVGRRLSTLADSVTTVAHLHGNEFAVFTSGLSDRRDVLTFADGIRGRFSEPIQVDKQPLLVSASIGISVCPEHADDFDSLLRRADIAMASAKEVPNQVAIFEESQEGSSQDQLGLLSDLRNALSEPGAPTIVPYYQPQIDMPREEVVGVEALIRWLHPTRGLIMPTDIIRVAERSPIMSTVTTTMLGKVIEQLARWNSQHRGLRASVNVSVRDLHDGHLIDWIEARLRQHQVAPAQLQLEVTETALMSQTAQVVNSLGALRQLGVGASLDDFGTGFSSLEHLRLLPLTEIKIDRSFTQSILDTPQTEAIVRSVVSLAHELGLRVIAEGVENELTKTKLLDADCYLAQGWYYAAAMPAGDLELWLERGTIRT